MEPQRHPYPKDFRAHIIRVIEAIVDADQVTDKAYVDALFALVSGALVYQGTWDASTNTPVLADGTGTKGHYYVVNVAGTQDLGSGNISFTTKDRVVHNGTVWQKWDVEDQVTSVFGRLGDILSVSGDYTHAQIGSVTADQHHLEDTFARQVNIYHVSTAKGNDSAPNDGSLFKPFKTPQKAVDVGTDPIIILIDGSVQGDSIIVNGKSVSIAGWEAGIPNFGHLGTITVLGTYTLNIDNLYVDDIDDTGLAGMESGVLVIEEGQLNSQHLTSGKTGVYIRLTQMTDAVFEAIESGASKLEGIALIDGSKVKCTHGWLGNSQQAKDFADPTLAQDLTTKNYIDVTHSGLPAAHHAKYTDGEAALAMGAKGDANPLNHDKYSDSNVLAAMNIKAGKKLSTDFAGNPKVATVTFGTAFPDANYSVNIIGVDGRSWTVQSQLAGSFIIDSGSNVALTGDISWIAIPHRDP